MAETLQQHIKGDRLSGYIELFDIDLTLIGGDIFRFVPMTYLTVEGTDPPVLKSKHVLWQGNAYTPMPIQVTGIEYNGTTEAPPTPTMTVSNINRVFRALIISLGDITGATLTRWRTFEKYLDEGAEADDTQHFPVDMYIINQKTEDSKIQIVYSLKSALDMQHVKIPRRQILRDYGFPGAGIALSGV